MTCMHICLLLVRGDVSEHHRKEIMADWRDVLGRYCEVCAVVVWRRRFCRGLFPQVAQAVAELISAVYQRCMWGRKPLHKIADVTPPEMLAIKEYEEIARNNSQRPGKGMQMLANDGTVYYWNAQLTGAPGCTSRGRCCETGMTTTKTMVQRSTTISAAHTDQPIQTRVCPLVVEVF